VESVTTVSAGRPSFIILIIWVDHYASVFTICMQITHKEMIVFTYSYFNSGDHKGLMKNSCLIKI
jgi:hypothetical protein